MKKSNWYLLVFGLVISHAVTAQDEGTLTKLERVATSKSFYFTVGPSYKFGNNSGDYCCGLHLEAGFLKRINRVLSIGPALSFGKFNYDEAISDSFGDDEATGNNMFQEDDGPGLGYEVYVVYLEGGDLNFFSAGLNAKINFIPDDQGKKFSVYGIVKPFILLSKRSEVTASVELWYANVSDPLDDPADWSGGDQIDDLSPETPGLERWAAETEVSGGMNLGVGAEYALSSGFVLFVQSTVGLTLPITYINTSEFAPLKTTGYYHDDYPFVKKGFTTLNVSLGVAYRF